MPLSIDAFPYSLRLEPVSLNHCADEGVVLLRRTIDPRIVVEVKRVPDLWLVHAWSAPLWYLWRPYIVYRSRKAVPPAEPGTSGRRWRKIGVPY